MCHMDEIHTKILAPQILRQMPVCNGTEAMPHVTMDERQKEHLDALQRKRTVRLYEPHQ